MTAYGSVGHGGNDTGVFQNALNLSAANHEVLEVPAGTYNVSPLTFPNNANVVMDAGATVEATSGYSQYQHMLNVVGVSNVRITGTPGKSIFQILDGSSLKVDSHDGRKVKVKGFLIRRPDEDRLNATSIEVVGLCR